MVPCLVHDSRDGFPSPDSDFDLRGVHLLPIETVVGLDEGDQTVEKEGIYDGLEIDLVTHDASKFFALMLRCNGYVLEQIFSPLVVFATKEFDELKSITADCITKHHAHHYLGFAATQWKLFGKESPPRVKPLLHVYRVLLTGIHLMRTGEVEANLVKLNETATLLFLDDLISQKQTGPEKGTLSAADLDFHTTQYEQLTAELELVARCGLEQFIVPANMVLRGMEMADDRFRRSHHSQRENMGHVGQLRHSLRHVDQSRSL
ncbi:DNA polymerase beta superfamily protein [Novipirellula aureliae]